MKLLLDQGLSRGTVALLDNAGIDAVHVGDIGFSTAEDESILQKARDDERTIVTLDADFHAILALSGATLPSVIRLRIQGLRAEATTKLLLEVLDQCHHEITIGAVVTVQEHHLRIRRLPLLRTSSPHDT